MVAAIIEHAALGGIFATTGACLRGRCEHRSHRLIFGTLLVVIESVVMVSIVG